MSVIHKKDKKSYSTSPVDTVGNVDTAVNGTEKNTAASESTAVLLSMMFKVQIAADRKTGTNAITDEMILQSVGIVDYQDYEDKHAYTAGEIFRSGDNLYEVVAAHTSNEKAYPVDTTPKYYRLIEPPNINNAEEKGNNKGG